MQEIHRVCWEAGGAAMAMCMSAREDVVDQGTCHSIVGRVRHWVGATEALALIHIGRGRRLLACRCRWSPDH